MPHFERLSEIAAFIVAAFLATDANKKPSIMMLGF
jgi:hypothetical protein